MANAKAAKLSSAGVVPNPKARLLDQVREVIRFKHYSIGTGMRLMECVRLRVKDACHAEAGLGSEESAGWVSGGSVGEWQRRAFENGMTHL